ncbi:MAG: hypothetical protein K2K53_00100, partial [Oscillospiraceae bacterium]|nr:hypothetical protein [Oscillospiraceae bacterium]
MMIQLLALAASPAPSEGASLTLSEAWGKVVYGVSWFFGNLSPAFVWAIFGILICGGFFGYYWYCLLPRPHSLEWIAMAEERAKPRRLTLTIPRHPMERRDILPILLLTAVYALTAFLWLGDFDAPQSVVKFQRGDSYEFSYGQPVTVDRFALYTSLGTGYYTLEWQEEDGAWRSVRPEQRYNTLFKWHVLDLTSNVDQNGLEMTEDNKNLNADPHGPITASRFRITASNVHREEGLWLAELVLWGNGEPFVPSQADEDAGALFDERGLWADKATYMNSSYFDEIYHPRTAME